MSEHSKEQILAALEGISADKEFRGQQVERMARKECQLTEAALKYCADRKNMIELLPTRNAVFLVAFLLGAFTAQRLREIDKELEA